MHSRVVRRLSELAAITHEWDALLTRSATNEPTLSPLWQKAWWRVFGRLDGRKLAVLLVYDSDRLVGLAPLLWRRYWHRGALPLRRLELLGSGENEADETCSDYIGLLAERNAERDVAQEFGRALRNGRLGNFDDVVLDALNGDAPITHAVTDALKSQGLSVQLTHDARRDAPLIRLPATWEQYLSDLSPSRRAFVRKSERKLRQWAGNDLQFHSAKTAGDLRRGRAILQTLHGERWGHSGKTPAFASRAFCEFHSRVMPALLERGALDLRWITVADRPIAALYNIVWNNKIHFYQCGRSLDVPKNVRPGIAIHATAIRSAIEDGRREYDFLANVSGYAERLSTHRCPIVKLRATHRHSLIETGRQWLDKGIEQARRMRRFERTELEQAPEPP